MDSNENQYYPDTNLPGGTDEVVNDGSEWLTEDGEILSPEEAGQLEALGAFGALDTPEVDEVEEEEIASEDMMVRDPIQLIPMAIANNRLLQITYQNRKGETKLYTIEPYEIGGNQSHPAGYLWGYDRNASTIKSFFLSNLIDIQMLEEMFIPRQG